MADNKDVKRYKCMNFGACTKADSGEIIEIDAMETIGGAPDCPHCHQHTLEEIIVKPTNWKLYAGIAAAVAVLGIGVGVALSGGDEQKTSGNDTAVVDTIKKDTTVVAKPGTLNPTDVKEPKAEESGPDNGKDKTPQPPKPQPTTYNMGWGTYDGPMPDGKPNGFGGTITVRSSHSIDLKKASGETVEVGPGDRIEQVKMDNGRLRQGEIHFADGTRRFISGL